LIIHIALVRILCAPGLFHSWRQLKFVVFDAPEAGGPFEERLALLQPGDAPIGKFLISQLAV